VQRYEENNQFALFSFLAIRNISSYVFLPEPLMLNLSSVQYTGSSYNIFSAFLSGSCKMTEVLILPSYELI
jgi:hypothetical protein